MPTSSRRMHIPAVGLLFLTLSGCATLVHGRSETVVIASEPSDAVLSINGVEQGRTPAVVSLRRGAMHTLHIEADGHAPVTTVLTPGADYRWVLLNLLLFHPAIAAGGAVTDLVSGAHHRLTPDAVSVQLPVDASAGVPAAGSTRVPWQPMPLGSRVRIRTAHVGAPMVVGTVLGVRGDTLQLDAAGGYYAVHRGAIAALEVSIGPDRLAGARRGAGRGALTGLAAGFGVGTLLYGLEGGYYGGLLYGAPAGLAVGAAAGAVAAPPDRWRRLPP